MNKRLSGDITDDKRFPKETFPNKQHCPVKDISKKNVKIGMKMNNDNFLYQGML